MPTIIAMAALSSSLTTAFHEGIHALTCGLVGGQLVEFSALHVDCLTFTVMQTRLVAGSASLANLALGFACLAGLRQTSDQQPRRRFFLWLFMLMNWLSGAGYWMFSGIANVGDWATVIDGWQPHGLWRVVMTVVGSLSYLGLIWYALRVFGRIVGGQDSKEQIGRANRLTIPCYFGALVVAIVAGLFNPYGFLGLPAVAGLFATAGAYAALLWMMQWFSSAHFPKSKGEALIIAYSPGWLLTAATLVFIYAVILGMGFRFN